METPLPFTKMSALKYSLRIACFIFFLLTHLLVKSQDFDYLKPDVSALTLNESIVEYNLKIRKKLLASLTDLPMARVVVLPSFEPEYAISIEKGEHGSANKKTTFYLILRTCNPSIYETMNSNNDTSKVYSRKIVIDSEFAVAVEKLFLTAISKAKYSLKPTDGLDGTSYCFISTVMFEGIHCAYTWSPDSGSKMFELVAITDLMREYCKTKDAKFRNEIIYKSVLLIDRLEHETEENRKLKKERFIWISLAIVLLSISIWLYIKQRMKNNNEYS